MIINGLSSDCPESALEPANLTYPYQGGGYNSPTKKCVGMRRFLSINQNVKEK